MARNNDQKDVDVLERGNIFFVYRPQVEEESPEGMSDVQQFYMILSKHGEDRYRMIVIGRKKLPEIEDGGDRNWGFVSMVSSDPTEIRSELQKETYETKTRGERELPAARPVGEGVYAIVHHEDHTHLAYVLELPESEEKVQRAFNIEEEASYVISVKNPDQGSPRAAGLDEDQQADYPKRLQEIFRDLKFANPEPTDFLNYEGCEILLIGAEEDPSEELGIEFNVQDENRRTAEMFDDLRMQKSKHPIEPLFEGEWE
jgi:hypothetical protein